MGNEFISRMLITKSVKKVRDFYKVVFPAWELSDPDSPRDWVQVDTGSGPGGIIMNQAHDVEPLAWLPCVQVDSIQETLKVVLKNKGSVVLGAEPMPDDSGTYAIIADPKGAQLALRQMK